MLTEQDRAEYERAAVALEKHERTPKIGNLGMRAYRTALEEMDSRNVTIEMIDDRAARLLRDCLAGNEVMR